MMPVDDHLMTGPLFVVLKVAYVDRMEDYIAVQIKPMFCKWLMEANIVRAWHPSSSIKLLPKDYWNINIGNWLISTTLFWGNHLQCTDKVERTWQ